MATFTAASDTINGNWTYGYDEFNHIRTSSKTNTPSPSIETLCVSTPAVVFLK